MNLTKFTALTRFEQTLFGLPYVFASAILSLMSAEDFSNWMHWLWVLPAFLAARVSGMSFNQLIDRYIDAENPRTQKRPLPSGMVSPLEATITAWASLALFIFSCWKINPLCFFISFFAGSLLLLYSYMKRFSAACHFVIALIHFLVPVATAAAITGSVTLPSVFLGLIAFFSVSGCDIVYAIQDYAYDSQKGLHSIPVALGPKRSLLLSKALHLACVFFVFFLGAAAKLPLIYYGAPLVVGALLGYFHLRRKATGRDPFMFINVYIATTMFVFVSMGALWHG